MTFIDFTQQIMPYINSIILFGGGWFLKSIITHKNSQIETLTKNSESTKNLLESTKVLVEMYDTQKFKDHLDFKMNDLEERHKVEIEKVFKISEQGVKDKILELASPWLVKYNELLDYEFHYLLKLSDTDLEKVLKLLPQNRQFLEEQLKDIKSGKLKSID